MEKVVPFLKFIMTIFYFKVYEQENVLFASKEV
jgi:hypothetical protein